MKKNKTLHVVVSGKVQGVWYRGWTVKKAQELGLNGWVRNRYDGHVEILVSGSEILVKTLIRLLWDGPSSARVEKIVINSTHENPKKGFIQKPTV